MTRQRLLAAGMALLLTVGVSPLGAQQPPTGVIAGRATNEARRPFTNYIVQLRNPENAQIVATVPLDTEGRFQFANVPLSQKLIVELYNVRDKEMVCTEGPYALTADEAKRDNVNIDCGAGPAAFWLLAATTGAVAAIGAVSIASPSR